MKYSLANHEPLNKLTGLMSKKFSSLTHKTCLTKDQALIETLKIGYKE